MKPSSINDSDRSQWIDNDEGLYSWWRRSRQSKRAFIRENKAEIDAAIGVWTQTRSIDEVLATLGAARVPAGRVYTAKDICEDPHYRARDMILPQHTRDGDDIEVPGIVPKLSATPGTVRSSAPHLGDDTDSVLLQMGLSQANIKTLREKGIVA